MQSQQDLLTKRYKALNSQVIHCLQEESILVYYYEVQESTRRYALTNS